MKPGIFYSEVKVLTPELINWLAALAFLLGIIAIILEIIVFPGFGIAGILGIVLFGWGVLLASVDAAQITKALVLALIATIIVLFTGLKLMSRYKLWFKLALQNRQQREDGYVAPLREMDAFTGKEGIALTPLRPSGTVEVEGQRLDVVTDGEFIAPGSQVTVVKVEGTRVVVKQLMEK